ncbi:zinc finger protein ZAT12-like [Senna tora]|uniref:Zinc finger protein ZAT12-like n=1 Tax=Senna tora TaxID=362788 RepID=A0A834SW50_9FABA|nr:zinc finger protein ZAT12-like [Senna tora]
MTKQIRDVDVDHHHNIAIANCLMLLSHQGAQFVETSSIIPSSHHDHHQRVFECKTCNRQFPSFQALGGHRASHKKPRIPIGGGGSAGEADDYDYGGKANKTHECSICGLEFAIGQALGVSQEKVN